MDLVEKSRASHSRAPSAFTLIELLVVVTIIVMLLAMLLPSIKLSVETSRRSVCASNVHQWSLASINFSADHFSAFPAPFHPNYSGLHVFPHFMNRETTALEEANWQTYGTNLNTWQQYGVSPEIMRCPSRLPMRNGWYDLFLVPGEETSYWGQWYQTMQYLYVGGITTSNSINYVTNFGNHPPAGTTTANSPSSSVLVADDVAYNDPGWGDVYSINHAGLVDSDVAFQNIGFSDGHTQGSPGSKLYPGGLLPTYPGNWNMAGPPGYGAIFWYWGGP